MELAQRFFDTINRFATFADGVLPPQEQVGVDVTAVKRRCYKAATARYNCDGVTMRGLLFGCDHPDRL
jgi:hypothetical protein